MAELWILDSNWNDINLQNGDLRLLQGETPRDGILAKLLWSTTNNEWVFLLYLRPEIWKNIVNKDEYAGKLHQRLTGSGGVKAEVSFSYAETQLPKQHPYGLPRYHIVVHTKHYASNLANIIQKHLAEFLGW